METADDTSPIWEFWTSLEVIPFDEVVRIAIIIILAFIAHIVTSRVIRGFVNRAVTKAPEKRRKNRPAPQNDPDARIEEQLQERTTQRARAFGTLLRSATVIVIWSIAIIMILSILGINVTPILASAGVAGVVIGFGAQTLVADYLAGISMIFEDQLGVGDVVNVGDVLGTVEEVALRYTRIRDFNGTVWYIRNGQMPFVANQSQGWTFLGLDLPVSVDTDLQLLREVINSEGERLFREQTDDGALLEAPYFSGVEALAATSVTARVSGRLRPGTQFAATRRIRQAMIEAFERRGIEAPQPLVRIDEMHKPDPGPRLEP
jgi:small-conductance mechanosensitive channel